MKPSICLLLCIICYSFAVHASHLKGAELTVKPAFSDALTYTFTLIVYEEKGGIEEAALLDVSNGMKAALTLVSEENLNGELVKRIYTATHTYAAPGLYQVSYTGSIRNDAINIYY